MKYEIDELDRGIIKLLSKDGRMSFTEIAGKMNVTEKTVRLRYKNLIDNHILEVVGVVNPIALGLKAGAIIQLKVRPQSIHKVIDELKTFREIRYVTLTSGQYSLLVQIAVPSQDEITDLLLRLNGLEDITEVNSIVQLEVFKNTFEFI
ncbi:MULTISPECIES: Lrp/AsnC family transcriptional regulator [Bacillaceae]|uniref:AsnC family transcriptional regulator n=2 Tax=Bacillus infantis TaxID=324767 RepID=U5LEF5_9BACI|nr:MULTISPECIES: AsnC family transcriptional regulator [Bacillus]OXT16394.1 AsnC family transcriptional regulator [Bacillus sp. OG2]AGX04987.1 AsnC family transcriptional regulator [Bacillus infantis NRRL B-14911]EAR66586.1 transcriptional regulator [Bacillus sp. NRRL B-14911]MCA1035382.1 AsnC family transcriptional regulator [Bacillus infantis]MCA1038660.1 AsnC family transcriptional regulator [Bacillus infantis]